jgi:hypothetical protein
LLTLASHCHHFLLSSLVSQRCHTIGGRMGMGPRLLSGLICREIVCARKYSVRGKVRGAGDFQLMVTAVPSKNATGCISNLSLLLGINLGAKLDCRVQLCVACVLRKNCSITKGSCVTSERRRSLPRRVVIGSETTSTRSLGGSRARGTSDMTYQTCTSGRRGRFEASHPSRNMIRLTSASATNPMYAR